MTVIDPRPDRPFWVDPISGNPYPILNDYAYDRLPDDVKALYRWAPIFRGHEALGRYALQGGVTNVHRRRPDGWIHPRDAAEARS